MGSANQFFDNSSAKRVLITHIDLDGISVPMLCEFFKIPFDSMFCFEYDSEEKDPEIEKNLLSFDEYYFTDFYPSEDFFKKIAGKRITIFDHHDSSEPYKQNSSIEMFHDKTRCGTKIFFDEFICKRVTRISPAVDYYISLVNTYDLWSLDSPLWKEALNLNRVLYQMTDWTQRGLAAAYPFIELYLRKLQMIVDWRWTTKEQEIIQKEEEKENASYEQALKDLELRKDEAGCMFGVVPLSGKISIIASRILRNENYSFLDYLVILSTYKGLNGKISVRSDRGFDCTKLAGIRGHKPAAGGTTTIDIAKRLLEEETALAYAKEGVNEIALVVAG